MVSRPKVIYHPRPNSTPEAELDALSAVYALALQKYYESEETAEPAPEPDDLDDYKRATDDAGGGLPSWIRRIFGGGGY